MRERLVTVGLMGINYLTDGGKMHGIQSQIARRAGYTRAYVSQILSGTRRVKDWNTAKRFARATNTWPQLWLEGSPAEIKRAVIKAAFN